MKTFFILLLSCLVIIGFQNCGSSNGMTTTQNSTASSSEALSLSAQETIHLQPEITERLNQETGQIDAVNAPEVTTISLVDMDQSVQARMATRIYGPFETKFSFPMIFKNLEGYQYFGFYIEKSTLSGSDLEVLLDGRKIEILRFPVTKDGNSVDVNNLFWVKLNRSSRTIQLKILNHVGVVRVLDYIITKSTPETLNSKCLIETLSYCHAFLRTHSYLN